MACGDENLGYQIYLAPCVVHHVPTQSQQCCNLSLHIVKERIDGSYDALDDYFKAIAKVRTPKHFLGSLQ